MPRVLPLHHHVPLLAVVVLTGIKFLLLLKINVLFTVVDFVLFHYMSVVLPRPLDRKCHCRTTLRRSHSSSLVQLGHRTLGTCYGNVYLKKREKDGRGRN